MNLWLLRCPRCLARCICWPVPPSAAPLLTDPLPPLPPLPPHCASNLDLDAVGVLSAFLIVLGFFGWRGYKQWRKHKQAVVVCQVSGIH